MSGQIPADNAGNLIEGSIGEKTAACIKNVTAVLEAAGSHISKVVKVTVSPLIYIPNSLWTQYQHFIFYILPQLRKY